MRPNVKVKSTAYMVVDNKIVMPAGLMANADQSAYVGLQFWCKVAGIDYYKLVREFNSNTRG